jgi:predicted phosphoadenosine phosphosulfate sulfurtransferase
MRLTQVYSNNRNVLAAARERIGFIFDQFESIHVSISGGKDSTVLAHLVLAEARRRDRRVGIFFLDEEVIYDATTEMVSHIMEEMAPDHVIPLWLQFPFHLTNATSLTETQFIPWEPGKHNVWLRPKKGYAIKAPPWDREKEIVADKNKGFGFYDVFVNFERCYTNTAFLVGLRGTESPNRWRTVSKNPATIGGRHVYWATAKGANFSMYPLYDWNFHDVWKYIFENGLRYHKIYDYQMRKGYPIQEMRISSLIHEKSFKAICDLQEFEPATYNKLVKRAKGIALAQETGKNAKLFRARKLPKNYDSWRDYRDFLLATHPDPDKRDIMARRFARHLNNEWVARQQVRQLILNDYENNLPVENKPDPRDSWITYYMENL